MSLPSIEPTPGEDRPLPPARRRRQRRTIVPEDTSERAVLLRTLARRTVPSFDFFLFSLLAGIILGIAMLMDAPALFVLAVLVAPFMSPALGIAMGTLAGTPRFILESLASMGIGSLIVFLCGAVAGWATTLLPERAYTQAFLYSHFSWTYFFVLSLGSALTAYLLARTPNQKPLVASVAIAYGLYLPAAAAGFGMTSGPNTLWPDGLLVFGAHLIWSVVAVIAGLAAVGLRPLRAGGYALGAVYAAAGVALLVWMLPRTAVAAQTGTQTSEPPAIAERTPAFTATTEGPADPDAAATGAALTVAAVVEQPSRTPEPTSTTRPSATATATTTPTPTRTLVPSRTPTVTITPEPTPIYARIEAAIGDGALVRENPDYSAPVVQSVINGTLVEVLPEVATSSIGETWVHIRLVNGKEGWVVRTLLRTATPTAN